MLRRLRIAFVLVGVLVLGAPAHAKILGVFQGKIIKASKRYLYVQGKSGFVRKVNVTHAVVEYDDDFPAGGRAAHPSDELKVATLVRVTAEQKNDNWQASEILILAPESAPGDKATATSAELLKPQIK